MKLSWNWLQTFLTFPTSPPTPEEVEKKLTLHTAELEEIIPLKPYFDRIFAGKLLNWTQHPKAKKLHIGTFDLGPQRKKQIIFGSVHKVKKGSIYPIAINGAKLASGIEIKETEIKGEKSEGMICDNNELGFKNEELLTFSEKTIGKSLPEICIEFQDTLFDIDNKSLTHRPDLMGHHGFAREIAAIFGGKLKECPRISLPHKGEPVPVIIKSDKCRRFCALKISKIKITPSCLATQVRLENLGIRSISNVVDTTNRILLEFGQPMHAFDAEKILLPLIIRQAKKGEKLLALDGEEYELTPQDTVVADKKGVLSVAGIMGGSFSGVTENTKEIIFECANWDPVAIRKTSKRLGLRSESSMRYEKSLDSLSCRPALLAASEKLLELCPEAKIETNLTDEFPYPPTQKSIILDPNLVRSRSGIDILDEEIIQKLESIGFLVTKKNKNLNINIPSFRATKDIEIPEDLIEEVVRLHGFEDIKSKLPNLPLCPPCRNILRELEWQIKEFASSRGFLETYNYSFVNNKEGNFTGQEDSVEIENPLSKEQNQLRQTLIYNLVKNLESDLRTHKEVNFFEITFPFVINLDGKTIFGTPPSKSVP